MKPFEQQTYYELLEVPVTAQAEEIRSAYSRAMETYSPDSIAVYALVDPDHLDALRARLTQALETLTAPELRTRYDQSLGIASPETDGAQAPAPSESLPGAAAPVPGAGEGPSATTHGSTAEVPPIPEADPVMKPAAEPPAPPASPSSATAATTFTLHPAQSNLVISYVRSPPFTEPMDLGSVVVTSLPVPVQTGTPPPALEPPAPREHREGEAAEAGPEAVVRSPAAPAPQEVGSAPSAGADTPPPLVEPSPASTSVSSSSGVAPQSPAMVEPPAPSSLHLAPASTSASTGAALPVPAVPSPGSDSTRPAAVPGVPAAGAVPTVHPAPEPPRIGSAASPKQPPARSAPPTAPRHNTLRNAERNEGAAPRTHTTPPPLPDKRKAEPRPVTGQALRDAPVLAQESAIATSESALAQVAAKAREPRPKPLEVPPEAEFNGELLRRVRESRGLSLRVVADRTRISTRHLENVEADRYGALPATVYLRGILMNLARELGLDPLRVSKSYLALASEASKRD